MGFIEGFFRGWIMQLFGDAVNNLASRIIQGSDYKYQTIIRTYYEGILKRTSFENSFNRNHAIPKFKGDTSLHEMLNTPFINKKELFKYSLTIGLFHEQKKILGLFEDKAKVFIKKVSLDPSIICDASCQLSAKEITDTLEGVFYMASSSGIAAYREFKETLPYDPDVLKICRNELTNESILHTLDSYFCHRTKVIIEFSALWNQLDVLDNYKEHELGTEAFLAMFLFFPEIPELALKELKEKNLEKNAYFESILSGFSSDITVENMSALIESMVISKLLLTGILDSSTIDKIKSEYLNHLEVADSSWRVTLRNVLTLSLFFKNKIDYSLFKQENLI